jgi:hypothetical protein
MMNIYEESTLNFWICVIIVNIWTQVSTFTGNTGIIHFSLQYVAKSIATCKKNSYIINQNHFFFKLLWSHFCIDFNKFYTKTFRMVYISELSIFWLFICSLCLYEWFLFVHNLNITNTNWLWFSYIFQLKINPKN